jgi:hypothetical protein
MEEIRMRLRKVGTERGKQNGMNKCRVGRRKVEWVDEGEWDGEK